MYHMYTIARSTSFRSNEVLRCTPSSLDSREHLLPDWQLCGYVFDLGSGFTPSLSLSIFKSCAIECPCRFCRRTSSECFKYGF